MAAVGAGVQGPGQQRNQEATIWVGGLDDQLTEELLFELFINAGPVVSVSMPKDKITGLHQGFAFVEFETVEDAEYCLRLMSNVKLHSRHLKMNRASKDRGGEEEFNAKLFVGSLDMEVDEKLLFDTFSQFGAVLSAKVMTEAESDKSRGFGFITFESFESADRAIELMNGQYLSNRCISVGYAFKKDGSKGERHGSAAERELAAKSSLHRIRAPAANMMGAQSTPGFLGGRLGPAPAHTSALAQPPPPPPPPSGPPPMQGMGAYHHPSRGAPPMMMQQGGYGMMQQQPPPPPPQFGGGPMGMMNMSMMQPPPPPQFAGGPPPFRPPPFAPQQQQQQHYQQQPPQFGGPPPPPPQGFPGMPPPPPQGFPGMMQQGMGMMGSPPPPQQQQQFYPPQQQQMQQQHFQPPPPPPHFQQQQQQFAPPFRPMPPPGMPGMPPHMMPPPGHFQPPPPPHFQGFPQQ